MEKVLFIDNSALVIETVQSLLEHSAYQLCSAPNGIDGLCEMIEQRPAYIFVDALAAKLDGFQFCALVKGNAEYSHIPVILVLEKDDYLERAKAMALGAEAVLSKPFNKSDVLTLMAAQQSEAA